jgi:histone acetyltransferase (RNA polymerase elongator complex component)
MMPNLLGSNPTMDKKSLKKVFEDSSFRPDELKIYPAVVVKNSKLEKLWND